ncbi:MAG: alpha/beta fold hydrolase [Ramlibacter sp.]
MQSRSTLARLQQATTLLQLSGALAWLAWWWSDSPLAALGGFVGMALVHSVVLGVEFVALRLVGGEADELRPTWPEAVRAWLGETLMATRVFSWRQPFRWRQVPDQLEVQALGAGRRGVVFIHGFICNRGFWTPWLQRLRAEGRCFVAVNLEPVFGSIDDYVPIIERAVAQVTDATGLPPILVCHSMGGLAARAWLRAHTSGSRVHHVITIASPHHGTWLARFGFRANSRQMRRDSDWRTAMERETGAADYEKFTCWYSNCDNIVFPASTATLPGARNLLVRGAAHVELAFHERVMSQSLELLAAS